MAAFKPNGTSESNMPPTRPPIVPMLTPSPPPTEETGPNCSEISMAYDVAPAVICAVCIVFGILYCFFGYRFFKATMFMTGFIFGALVTYLICLEENLLPLEGKIGASLAAGVLCGLITMLVQYVGLFMTGFNFGLLLGISALVIMEFFYHPTTKWIPIGVMFCTGLVFALAILYFQRSLTILGTSFFGAALLTGALDYFIELHMMVNYVWERIKAEPSEGLCWFSWVILGLWPLAFVVGGVAQWRVTGRDYDHQEVIQRPRRKKPKPQPAAAAAASSSASTPVPRSRHRDRQETRQSRYRHLYQIRRVNGDVITQNYVHNIRNKLSPGLRILSEAQYQQTMAPPSRNVLLPPTHPVAHNPGVAARARQSPAAPVDTRQTEMPSL